MNKATQAREDTIIGQEKEQIALAWNSLILDKTTGKITDIDEDNFETELNNSGNNTEVADYIINNENNGFSVTFIDTTHEYIVDKNGNITLKGTKTIDNVEIIEEEYIIENSELSSEYNIDGWGSDTSDGKPRKNSQWLGVDCYRTYASWGGGRAGMYFEPMLDFSNITKIEADIILGSNLNGLTNTTTLGVQLDAITKDDIFDVSETVVDKTSTGTEYHVTVDTSNVSGAGYIKIYSAHGSENGAYTVATGVINLKIYKQTNKPKTKFTYKYTGSYQEFEASETGYYKIECFGARGGKDNWGGSFIANYGFGGYAKGVIKLNKGEKLYLYVGENGADGVKQKNVLTKTSFNGGGAGIGSSDSDDGGGAGGGATDVRLVSGDWDNFESLKSRIMVAGGGSGGATVQSDFTSKSGGSGGGLEATGSIWKYSRTEVANHTYNATQITGYKFGIGQDCITKGNAGGAGAGGGYYGGYSSTDSPAGGAGGGSGYISGYDGCNAISETSTENNIIHTNQSIHYSGKKFLDVELRADASATGKIIIEYLGQNYN